ncbi:hypothetical protein [Marinobacter sp. SS21]|uniref:hypothetical protein n=1 Tax=Marinobacter sp. SS21 TaxID=2979460 RepID=UPI00233066B5|nr:hypothetical protein [Marinobacter sp. SS21]MDC0661435.1 hypothetical protein [Marinobacter sp. SS21]
MFEHVSSELLSIRRFLLRMARYFAIAVLMLLFGLLPGVVGFHVLGLSLGEATLNALSLLGGVEPPVELAADHSRWFVAGYGLFIEAVFFLAVATLLAPLIHRMFHRMHLQER